MELLGKDIPADHEWKIGLKSPVEVRGDLAFFMKTVREQIEKHVGFGKDSL